MPALRPAARRRDRVAVAIAVVGSDDRAGPERALGALHPRCIAAYLAAQDAGRRRHRPA
jgi:hypothetical protein